MSAETAQQTSQRIDRWLWCARIFKTRTLAAKFVTDGNVRITRDGATLRAAKASFAIRPGDTISFSRDNRLRVLAIEDCAERRGPASEAQQLYKDCSPPPPPKEERPLPVFSREKGAGRPTKKERRLLDALKTN